MCFLISRFLNTFSFLNSFIVCSPGTYKEGVGDELCMPCPLHSTASYSGSVECQCESNYFRSPKDPKSMPCTGNYKIDLLHCIIRFNHLSKVFNSIGHNLLVKLT